MSNENTIAVVLAIIAIAVFWSAVSRRNKRLAEQAAKLAEQEAAAQAAWLISPCNPGGTNYDPALCAQLVAECGCE